MSEVEEEASVAVLREEVRQRCRMMSQSEAVEVEGWRVAPESDSRTVWSDKRTLSLLQATRPIAEALRRTSCRRAASRLL